MTGDEVLDNIKKKVQFKLNDKTESGTIERVDSPEVSKVLVKRSNEEEIWLEPSQLELAVVTVSNGYYKKLGNWGYSETWITNNTWTSVFTGNNFVVYS